MEGSWKAVMEDVEVIGHRQAGHLRRLPPADAEPVTATVSLRRVLDAFASSGLAERVGGRYRRTRLGDQTLADYDASVGETSVDLLRRLAAGERSVRGSWELQTLAAAGFATVRLRTGDFEITEEGRALVAARGG